MACLTHGRHPLFSMPSSNDRYFSRRKGMDFCKKKHEKKPAFGRCPAGPSHISPFQLRQHLLLRGAPAPRSSVTQNASRAGEGQRPEYILDMPGSVLNVFCVFLCIVMRVYIASVRSFFAVPVTFELLVLSFSTFLPFYACFSYSLVPF